jgi:2,4-dienoyl-CoA reductase-like NADH-dependent reductase (Old Yellow Enzyme family)
MTEHRPPGSSITQTNGSINIELLVDFWANLHKVRFESNNTSLTVNTLFDPIRVGELDLPNRIIMAPLTRCRASDGRVPNDVMRHYYRQRATAGLIITEATAISPMGVGYPDTPGIWTEEQVKGWRRITEAVHQAGGRMVLQLWHVGLSRILTI